ncbi:MAG TPA: glutamine amidotransferase [Gammaproteobacteria bacterium]|nr:glutamine amidotransferase [Gammaproteobacteria bacterium]
MKSLLAIRHVPFEDLGCLEAPLTNSGYAIRYVDAPTADFTHIVQAKWDLLVVLGGPIGVNERDDYPFLGEELRLLELRLKHQVPTLGICLGSQLMAHALGARIHKNRSVEIGWKSLTLTSAGQDSSLQHFRRPVFHWHGESFDLPAGARHLASTDLCPNQAFSLGSSLLGLQFHPEVTARGLEQWYVGHTNELRSHGLSPASLREDAARFAPMLAHQATAFLQAWLTGH